MERESQLVEKIARALSAGATLNSGKKRSQRDLPASATRARSALRLGIGDDAAILAPTGRNEWVITCDAFLEGVHFLAKTHPPDSIGYKSLARATSDLAAMGATPRFFLLTLALPQQFPRAANSRQGAHSQSGKKSASSIGRTFVKQGLVGRGFSHDKNFAPRRGALAPEVPSSPWLTAFLKGMARAARELGVTIIGGDTTKSDRLFISITALGEIAPGRGLTRAGAKPGDVIYVSGKLGRAQLGLELVLRGLAGDPPLPRRNSTASLPQNSGRPRRVAGPTPHRLLRHGPLRRPLHRSSPPLRRKPNGRENLRGQNSNGRQSPQPPQKTRRTNTRPAQLALHGGEDYELLFTIPPRQAKKLRKAPGAPELTAIGEITHAKKIILIHQDGSHEPLQPSGWDPFRTS